MVAANSCLTKSILGLFAIFFGCRLMINVVWKVYQVLIYTTIVLWSFLFQCSSENIQKYHTEWQRFSTVQALMKLIISSMHSKNLIWSLNIVLSKWAWKFFFLNIKDTYRIFNWLTYLNNSYHWTLLVSFFSPISSIVMNILVGFYTHFISLVQISSDGMSRSKDSTSTS